MPTQPTDEVDRSHRSDLALVADTIEAQRGERYGVVTRVPHQLGVGVESLRSGVNQAEIDYGTPPRSAYD